jgi:hypothetical protein
MATLRIRFKLNPGREGISLGKLSKQTENIELFLRSLASDLGISDSSGLWLASNFRNGSVISTAEYQATVEREIAFAFNDDVYDLVRYKPSKTTINPTISHATIDRFARLRESLDADEKIGIGIIDVDTAKVKWRFINRLQLEEIGNSVETEVIYLGSVIGHTHEWNKGATSPYLYIREVVTGDLVKCVYRDEDYDKVAKLFQKKNSLVTVYGTVKLNRITEKYEITAATEFEIAPDFSNDDYEKFFGCAPDITNGLSAAEFIARGRASGN